MTLKPLKQDAQNFQTSNKNYKKISIEPEICDTCNGSGMRNDLSCSSCNGKGIL